MPIQTRVLTLSTAAALALLCPAVLPSAQAADAPAPKLDMPEWKPVQWADNQTIRNPVAFWVNDQGVVYVAETERAGNAVSDTRKTGHIPDNIMADVKLRSVEERVAVEKEWVAKKYFPEGYFTKDADAITRLRDTDGDGKADERRVVTEFRDWADGITSGVMEVDGRLLVTSIPSLWSLTELGEDGKAGKREELSSGYGVRFAFYGHDMHGLTMGPDGRVYFSIADRGFNVKTAEAHFDMAGPKNPVSRQDPKHITDHCRGSVFRCWPDGSGLELVYDGLRNPQELAFDDLGRLFTGDNNCDAGDRARWCYLPEFGDSGWRQDVQTFDKFAPGDGTDHSRGPWKREKMWELRMADVHSPVQPAWMIPPVAHYTAGPAGLMFNPGGGLLNGTMAGRFLLVDYTGGTSNINAIRNIPRGAFFGSENAVVWRFGGVTDLMLAPDGRLLASCFNGWGPTNNCQMMALTDTKADAKQQALAAEVAGLLKAGFQQRGEGELAGLLGHADLRIRQHAQRTLAARGDLAVPAKVALDKAKPFPARLHALWAVWEGAGRAKAKGAAPKLPDLSGLLKDADPRLVAQTLRVLGDLRVAAPGGYAGWIGAADAETSLYACYGAGKLREKAAEAALIKLLTDNADRDPVLRHAAAFALAEIHFGTDGAALAALGKAPSPDARLGVVLALRRLQSVKVAAFLKDADPQVAAEAARAIYDMDIFAARPALAACVANPTAAQISEPFLRRAMEAAGAEGGEANAAALAAAVTRPNLPDPYRLLALEILSKWDKTVQRERVWGHWADRAGHPRAQAELAVMNAQGALLGFASPNKQVLDRVNALVADLTPKMTSQEMAAAIADEARPLAYRAGLVDRLAATDRGAATVDLLAGLTGPKVPAQLRQRATARLLDLAPDRAVKPVLATLNDPAAPLADRQDALAQVMSHAAIPAFDTALQWLGRDLAAGRVEPGLQLDLLEGRKLLPAGHPLKARLEAAATGADGGRFKYLKPGMEGALDLEASPVLVVGGDAGRGALLFRDTAGKACRECHNTSRSGDDFDPTHEPNGSGGGFPNLAGIGAHGADYLMRSILDVEADYAPGFGKPSAMYREYPHMLKAGEVRDLVAYLGTLREDGAAHAHAHGDPPKAGAHAAPALAGHGPGPGGQVLAAFGALVGFFAVLGTAAYLVLDRNKKF